MNYASEFARLDVMVADCSPELRAFVAQLQHAPIFSDEAFAVLDKWDNIIRYARQHQGLEMALECARNCVSELRGEKIQATTLLPEEYSARVNQLPLIHPN